MTEVRIRYHHEREGWWAESPDLPGFSAVGDSFTEVREMAIEGVEFASDGPVEIVEERVPSTDPS